MEYNKPHILSRYKIGAFFCVDFQLYWGGTTFMRETYSGTHHTWYVKSMHDLSNIDKKQSNDIEKIYQKIYQKEMREEKLERIMKTCK